MVLLLFLSVELQFILPHHTFLKNTKIKESKSLAMPVRMEAMSK